MSGTIDVELLCPLWLGTGSIVYPSDPTSPSRHHVLKRWCSVSIFSVRLYGIRRAVHTQHGAVASTLVWCGHSCESRIETHFAANLHVGEIKTRQYANFSPLHTTRLTSHRIRP